MAPRKYEQITRAQAAKETRRRIVEATFALHDEQGIEATTMKQIAARAEVSIGTVYHHFPSYEDCIRACGEYTAQLFPLPEDAILQNIDGPAERITRLVQAWFSYYEQSPYLEGVRALRNKYKVIDEFMQQMEQALDRQVALALQRAPNDSVAAAGAAVLDVAVYTALARHGMSMDAAVQHIAHLVQVGCRPALPPFTPQSKERIMQAKIDEVASDIYRVSVHLPDIGPGGFTFNHFIINADEPLLFHCGMRSLFPAVSEAVGKLMPVEHLRWVSFGHVEGDECGSMNQWLAAAPQANVAHGQLTCELGLSELADRPPKALADGEVIELGGKRVRFLATPHVPHSWDAGVMFEETTGTLLCGDLFAHFGNDVLNRSDIVAPAIEAQKAFMGTAVTTFTAPTLRRLAELNPQTLALMHGASFHGNGQHQLNELAHYYEQELRESIKVNALVST